MAVSYLQSRRAFREIIPADQLGEGSVARSVAGKLAEIPSVLDLGCIGDGSTDDTTALQAVEDAAYARYLATGQQVALRFPEGTYAVSDPITKRSGVHWTGPGRIKRLDGAAPTGASFMLVTAEGVDDWSIDGLTLEATTHDLFLSGGLTHSANLGGRNGCLDIRGCSRWDVIDCRFEKYSFGMIIQGSSAFRVNFNRFRALTSKTIASMLDGTYTALANNTGGGSIVQHYGATNPDPNSDFQIIGNIIDNTGLDVAIQAYLFAFTEQPSVISLNVIDGSTTGIQLYCAPQLAEPVASTILAKALVSQNIIRNCWEQGLYVRSITGCQIKGGWVERCGLRGAYQGAMSSVVLRENPFLSIPIATENIHDNWGCSVEGLMVYNHGRSGVSCDAAMAVEHNNCTVRDVDIIRSRDDFASKADTALYVDNGKRLMFGDFSDIRIDNFANGVVHAATLTVHAYGEARFAYDRFKVRHCTVGLNLDMRRVGLHCVSNCYFEDISTNALYVRFAPGTKITENDFINCAAGITLQDGTLAANIPYLLSAGAIAIGTRGGSTVHVRNNRFWNVPTPHAVSSTGTNDTTFSDRVQVWEGDRVNGALVTGLMRAAAAPDTASVKSWSIGEIVWNSTPGTGPSRKICAAPGTYGAAVTPTVDATNAGTTLSNISSLSGVGPGIYITIAGVTGTKQITDIDIPTDRFVADDGAQVDFTLSFTPANLAAIGVVVDNTVVTTNISVVGNVLTFTTPPGTASLPVLIEVMHFGGATLSIDSAVDATVATAAIARATPTFVTENASFVYQGTVTWSGSGATLASTVTGVASTDIVYATIRVKPTQAAYLVRAVPSSNTITFELSAANTSNDAQISYIVWRP